MNRAHIAALLTLGLAGCASVAPSAGPQTSQALPPPPPPPPAEFGSILGAGAFHTPTGGHASCANLSVALVGETPQTQARMIALYGSDKHAVKSVAQVQARSAKIGQASGSAVNYSTTCDIGGHFAFAALPAGDYFLIAHVRVHPLENGQDDMVILQKVTLRLGETRQVGLFE